MDTVKKSLIYEVFTTTSDNFSDELNFKLEEAKALYEAGDPELTSEITRARAYHQGAVDALYNVYEDICGEDEEESHIGCYSYPNCDLAPTGCTKIMGADVEEFGHKD